MTTFKYQWAIHRFPLTLMIYGICFYSSLKNWLLWLIENPSNLVKMKGNSGKSCEVEDCVRKPTVVNLEGSILILQNNKISIYKIPK